MELFDKPEAQAFLNALDPQASSFTFQTFDDNTDRKAPSLARTLHGGLEDVYADLCGLSEQGAGVFVTVNETDGVGRKAENVTRIRALYGDFDGVATNRLKAWLPPNIEVQSSAGNSHLYWLGEFTAEEHHQFMAVLTAEFGADPGAKDIARVLRLPGFPHQKIDSKKGLKGSKEIVRMISSTPLSDLKYDFSKDIAPKLLAVARSTPSLPANQNTPRREGVKQGCM